MMRPTLNKSISSHFLQDQAEGKIKELGCLRLLVCLITNPLPYSLRKYCIQGKKQTANFHLKGDVLIILPLH